MKMCEYQSTLRERKQPSGHRYFMPHHAGEMPLLPEAVVPPVVVVTVRQQLARQQADASTHQARHQRGSSIPGRLLLVWALAAAVRWGRRRRRCGRHAICIRLGRGHHPGWERGRRAREGSAGCWGAAWHVWRPRGGSRIRQLARRPCLRRRRAGRCGGCGVLRVGCCCWIGSWARLRLLRPGAVCIQVGWQQGRGRSVGGGHGGGGKEAVMQWGAVLGGSSVSSGHLLE